MSRTYADVMQEIDGLKAEAAQLKASEVADVIGRIKQAIEVYGLTAADLGLSRPGRKPGSKPGRKPGRKPGPKPGKAAAAKGSGKGVKFRDGDKVWGGRGPRPKWLREAIAAGKSLKDFAV